jgi:hypothetical protein
MCVSTLAATLPDAFCARLPRWRANGITVIFGIKHNTPGKTKP